MSDETTVEAEKPVARIVTDKVREKHVPLKYPVEFGEQLFESIRVRRITGKELQTYLESLPEAGTAAMLPWVDCPRQVWDVMDPDDQQTVDEAAEEFIPNRLKQFMSVAGRVATDSQEA